MMNPVTYQIQFYNLTYLLLLFIYSYTTVSVNDLRGYDSMYNFVNLFVI